MTTGSQRAARELARAHADAGEARARGRPRIQSHLDSLARALKAAVRCVLAAPLDQRAHLPGAEWLLDNEYLASAALEQVREDLPPHFYRQLPRLRGPADDLPRIRSVVRAVLDAELDHVDPAFLERFVRAYQEVLPLTMGELWALPAVLRLVTLEDLVAATEVLALRCRQDPTARPSDSDGSLEQVVPACIRTLRVLQGHDWQTFFESVSLVERTLALDPERVYTRMDFPTRDRYRKAVERLARLGGRTEDEVAAAAVERAAAATRPRQRHVGWHLVDDGWTALARDVGADIGMGARLDALWKRHGPSAWVACIVAGTAVLLAGLASLLVGRGVGAPLLVLCLGVASVPASSIVIALLNWLATLLVRPATLPKMDFAAGLPKDARTFVVVPCLLTSASEVDILLRRLEVAWLGNRDPQLSCALLADLPDARAEHTVQDAPLVDRAARGVRRLNEHHGGSRAPIFHLFLRRRVWSPSENQWMAWERKRGKLMEWNAFLRGARDTTFVLPEEPGADLADVRYVITLDADTRLPASTVSRLVGTLAHPLNRAVFSEDGQRVVDGYTVVQPRIDTLPSSAAATPFSRIASGEVTLDLYAHAVSDVYQDLFGEGNYAGKGIYEVDAFARSLRDRVPQDALLSHDLFEGVHGRAALASDIVLYDETPASPAAWFRRLHRWARGDWQLLPWLGWRVPTEGGRRVPNRLGVLDRWKILDNLRRSLQAPALLAVLAVGWLALPVSPWLWTLGVVVAAALPVLLAALTPFAREVRAAARRKSGHARVVAWRSLARALHDVARSKTASASLAAMAHEGSRLLVHLTFLPFEAVVQVDAAVRTLWRLYVSHEKMLAWTSAAEEELRRHGIRARGVWREMAAAPAVALALGAGLASVGPTTLYAGLPLLLPWLVAPAIADRLGRPRRRRVRAPTREERKRIRRVARRTWLFFDRFVGPEDHWLPPDHFQEDPRGEPAHRTSPTNVGMYLIATLSAWDLGYITPLGLAARVGNTLASVSRLVKYRGHLLNWYDTHSLDALEPRYVSTVDSGNLVASLITLTSGLEDVRGRPLVRAAAARGLADSLGVFAGLLDGLDDPAIREQAAELAGELRRQRDEVDALCGEPESQVSLLRRLEANGVPDVERLTVHLIRRGTRVRRQAWLNDIHLWTDQLRHHVHSLRRVIVTLAPWMWHAFDAPWDSGAGVPLPSGVAAEWSALRTAMFENVALRELPGRAAHLSRRMRDLATRFERAEIPEAARGAACAYLEDLARASQEAARAASSLVARLDLAAREATALVEGMDFGFLFDWRRKLFRIGFNVSIGEPDPNHYDLLASEARLASYVAIARRQVPISHWLQLGRPFVRTHGEYVLLSWSATMFEYLMPTLLMQSPEGSLLDMSCRAAVRHQIAYGRRLGHLWGVSESGFHAFDQQSNYQYRAFGVPGLGFKRELTEDRVVAPYASLLALGLTPPQVLRNLDRLDALGMLGRYGYYEAIDFTPSRFHQDRASAIVRSYMAHHQGMILAAIVNALFADVMVRRFHRERHMATVDHLLWEQMPMDAAVAHLPPPLTSVTPPESGPRPVVTWSVPVRDKTIQATTLSNGRYTVLVTAAGASESTWRGVALTRSDPDPTLGTGGSYVYVQDEESGMVRGVALQPCRTWPEDGRVVFAPHTVEYHRRDDDIFLRTTVAVSPVDDVEIRRIHVRNETSRVRNLAVVSYAEIVLAPEAEDRRHPAFSKLFVEAARPAIPGMLIFHRRPRSEEEQPLFLAHAAVIHAGGAGPPSCCADRESFLGRTGSPAAPRGLEDAGIWDGNPAASLDPIAAVRCPLRLEPYGEAEVVFLWMPSRSLAEIWRVHERFSMAGESSWAFDLARGRSERELQSLDLAPEHLPVVQRLLSLLRHPDRRVRAPAPFLGNDLGSQSRLWSMGVSGDLPILLVRVATDTASKLVPLLLRAHAWWRGQGLRVDLVLLDEGRAGYAQPLRDHLHQELRAVGSEDHLNQSGGVYVLQTERFSAEERATLERCAAVVLSTEAGDLERQIGFEEHGSDVPRFVPSREPQPEPEEVATEAEALAYDNGIGGFSQDGTEYVVRLPPGTRPPAPWANVISNPNGGVLVTEAAIGSAWAVNSGENRLTPWRNDPVLDPPSTVVYLRDEETGEVWATTPSPCPAAAAYEVRHRVGETVWRHRCRGLDQELVVHATADAPAIVLRVTLRDLSGRPRRLTATCFTEWVLGTSYLESRPHLLTEFAHEAGVLLARNPFREEFGKQVAFLASDRRPHGLTCDRREFLGRFGDRARPAGLQRYGLSGTDDSPTDPCGVLQIHADLPPNRATTFQFVIGQGRDRAEALRLAARLCAPGVADGERAAVHEQWETVLGRVQVATPEPATDLLLNRWLPYQNIACRIQARAAIYQAGGGYGFRDQLQDVLALLPSDPGRARAHILEAARHQFREGDVLHWWHPPHGRGVRTRCSDDLLWLPYAAAEYARATGDETLWEEPVPYLEGAVLGPRERERYGAWSAGGTSETLYRHCLDAIERGCTAGRHGLPLIGTCDWNDGFDRLGEKGKGESVWLGWFLATVMNRFAGICEARGDEARARGLRERAARILQAAEKRAWDGEWFLRAWDDEGRPVGGHESEECRIDAIAQAWAVIAHGDAPPARARQALDSVFRHLVDDQARLIRLLAPPFERGRLHPGYIRGYPAGIRENGGQYTHAAVWVAWACSLLGDGERTAHLFDLLNPILRTRDPKGRDLYRVEPYVYAADVGGTPPHAGRGGWTWYTGSAGWAWRLGVERLLGLRLEGRTFRVQPCIPASWPGFRMTWRAPRATYEIEVRRTPGAAEETRLDGDCLPDGRIPVLEDDRHHAVQVVLGSGVPRRGPDATLRSRVPGR